MYKIVSNNVIMKFPVTLKPGFDVDKDEVKFGFHLHVEQKRSATQSLELKVPIMVNTGKLKINTSGGAYVSSAESVASAKKVTQEQKLAAGQAQMLDHSYISHASVKEKMDESFQSNATAMTGRTAQSAQQSAAARQAQANQRARLEQMNQSLNESMRSERSSKPKPQDPKK